MRDESILQSLRYDRPDGCVFGAPIRLNALPDTLDDQTRDECGVMLDGWRALVKSHAALGRHADLELLYLGFLSMRQMKVDSGVVRDRCHFFTLDVETGAQGYLVWPVVMLSPPLHNIEIKLSIDLGDDDELQVDDS